MRALIGHGLVDVRGAGLWAGVDLDPRIGSAHDVAVDMLGRGVLVKDTHEHSLRLAPPLIIERDELELLVATLRDVLADRLAA